MLSNQNALEAFFKDQKKQLELNYPGINLSIFLDTFTEIYNVELSHYHLTGYHPFKEELLKGTPLEYLKGFKYFYRSKFYVDKRVLIPRSETEILVDDSLQFIKKSTKDTLSLAEVGVGSFAIGLSVLIDTPKKIKFIGGDLSKPALEVAKINMNRLRGKLDAKHVIRLVESDRMENISGKFDLIVSNPPYIKRSQQRMVHHQVLSNEPDMALFLEDQEHDSWFAHFFAGIYDKLEFDGAFLMEGHEDNIADLKTLAQRKFSRVELKNDYTGSERFLHCFKEKNG